MRYGVLFFLTLGFFSLPAGAQEIQENWISARALGMGNAYSAVVSDYNALFYNPAALDKIHGLHLSLLTPQVGTDALTAYTTYQEISGGTLSSVINNFFGQQVWIGFNDTLAYSMNDFALAGFDNFNLSFNLNNPPYPQLNMYAANDYGIAGGFATSLLPNNALRVGFTVKRITRYGGTIALGPTSLANASTLNTQVSNLISDYGTGYGLDTGVLLTLPGPSQPTIALVWQNIGQTAFTPVTGTVAPSAMDDDPVIGYSMLFDTGALTVQPSLEFSHINLDQTYQLGLLMHVGVEMKFLGGLALRGGFNQGYWTAGVGIDLSYLRIDAASYGVELETFPGQLQDRRYILQVTMDLNFDPNFDFLKSGSSSGSGAASPGYQRR